MKFLLRHPRRVLALSVALTLAALVPALSFRLDTELANLLPDGAPAAEDYRLFLRTFGGFEKVFVVVRSPGRPLEDSDPLADAAERLADVLRESPEVAEAVLVRRRVHAIALPHEHGTAMPPGRGTVSLRSPQAPAKALAEAPDIGQTRAVHPARMKRPH